MVLKSQAISAHRSLTSSGQYRAARRVLYLLRFGRLSCGLGEIDSIIEDSLEAEGGEGRVSYDGRYTRFTLEAAKS